MLIFVREEKSKGVHFIFEEIRNSSLDTRSLRNAKAAAEYKEGNKPVACCFKIMWPLYKRRKLYKLSGMCFGRSMLCVSYPYRKHFSALTCRQNVFRILESKNRETVIWLGFPY
jgi:hypothetical protein